MLGTFRVQKILFLCAALTSLSSCFVQTSNSVNGDAKAFQPVSANASAAFSQVHDIIQKNCATCHTHTAFAGYSEADFVSNQLVTPKDPAGSLLFQMLKGSGAGSGSMPEDAAPLSASDILVIRNWITNMGAAAPTAALSLFGQSQIVINNSCVGCHKDLSGIQEADFVTKGWVVPGNANASKLYYKLIGAGVSGEPSGDMPLKGAPVTAEHLDTLRQWIDQMNPADFSPPVTLANTAFGKVQKIIGDNCMMCHKDFATDAQSDFIAKGLITPGVATTSQLYTRLIGSLPTSAKSDMPKAGAPLSADQLQDVADWINQIAKN